MEQDFKNFKDIILKRANASRPYAKEYKNASQFTIDELMWVLRCDFDLAVYAGVIDRGLVENYKELFDYCPLFCNECAAHGCTLGCCYDTSKAKTYIIPEDEFRKLVKEYCSKSFGFTEGYILSTADDAGRTVIEVIPCCNQEGAINN